MATIDGVWDGVPDNPHKTGWHWCSGTPKLWVAEWQHWADLAAITLDTAAMAAMDWAPYQGACQTARERDALFESLAFMIRELRDEVVALHRECLRLRMNMA